MNPTEQSRDFRKEPSSFTHHISLGLERQVERDRCLKNNPPFLPCQSRSLLFLFRKESGELLFFFFNTLTIKSQHQLNIKHGPGSWTVQDVPFRGCGCGCGRCWIEPAAHQTGKWRQMRYPPSSRPPTFTPPTTSS